MLTDPTGGTGYAFGQKLPSAHATSIVTQLPKAIDGVGGGSYDPSAPVTIGGAGFVFASEVVWATAGKATFQNGASAVFEAGASATFAKGTELHFQHDTDDLGAGARVYFTGNPSGSAASHAGVFFAQRALALFSDGASASFGGGGSLGISSGGHFVVNSGGTATLNEGGTYQLKDKLVTSGAGKVTKRYQEFTLDSSATTPAIDVDTTNLDGIYLKYSDTRAWTVTLTGHDARDPFDELIVSVDRVSADGGSEVTVVSGANSWKIFSGSAGSRIHTIRLQKLSDVSAWINTSPVVTSSSIL